MSSSSYSPPTPFKLTLASVFINFLISITASM